MARKPKEIKVTYVCKLWEEMTQEERVEAQKRLDDVFDFIFSKTLSGEYDDK